MTRPGWALAVEISVTLRLEVLVARIASGFTIASRSRKIDFLISIDSTTASTTKSASARSFMLVVKVTATDQCLLVLLAQLAARHGATRGVLEVLAAALEALVVDLDADHGEAVAGEDLGDAGAHRAEPDDADRGELAGRRRCFGGGGWSWGASSHAIRSRRPRGSSHDRGASDPAADLRSLSRARAATSSAQPQERVTPAPPWP